MNAVLAEYGFPLAFPKEVESESNAISTKITDADLAGRRDMRKILTFTIDPFDAKDFDDAISFQTLANGNFEIGDRAPKQIQVRTIFESVAVSTGEATSTVSDLSAVLQSPFQRCDRSILLTSIHALGCVSDCGRLATWWSTASSFLAFIFSNSLGCLDEK
jgi:hypothetical protein